MAARGLCFVDAGVCGGVWGLENGYALMLGGESASIVRPRPAIEALAPGREHGWLHGGPAGAGHFVKMIHNGIEYAMMQVYAEGFAPSPAAARVTLSARRLSHSRQVWVLVAGIDKAAALAAWRRGESLPMAPIRPAEGVDVWMDRDAAGTPVSG